MLPLRALAHRNYRLFFAGQSISLIGTWMQQIAVNWLTFRLTHSAFLLGVVGFTSRIPTFVFASLAGVLADRWNRHRILVFTQTLSMIQAFILAFLVITDRIVIWQIISLSLFLGLINAMDIPSRQSFVVDMVEKKEDLANAIALNSSMVNGARLIGPSIAGILIATGGEGVCFLINGISFLAVILSLLAMRINQNRNTESQSVMVWEGLKEGFTYAFGFKPIRYVLFLLALVSLMGMPYMVLMPIFAKDILHGGPHTLGFLMAASGSGALAGAIYLSWREDVMGLEKVILIGSTLFGIGLIIFSLSQTFWFSMIFLIITGFGMMIQMTSSNTFLQSITEEDKRGRVMSFYTMAFMGMVPFGSLLGGGLASKMGAQGTVMTGGITCILGAIVFAKKLPLMSKRVRRSI
jgi:MFS family permease